MFPFSEINIILRFSMLVPQFGLVGTLRYNITCGQGSSELSWFISYCYSIDIFIKIINMIVDNTFRRQDVALKSVIEWGRKSF